MGNERQKQIVVIGAGIGGLTTAAILAAAGHRVTVLEGQTYPGGSASTYYHRGYRFDSGATVAGGFQPDGPHAVLARMIGIDWPVRQHDPAWVVHLPDRSIAMRQDQSDVLAQFPQSAAFWQEQSAAADLAWRMSAKGLPWPPTDLAELWQLARVGIEHFPADLRLAPLALSHVFDRLRRYKLADDRAFVRFLDASLLISAQTTSQHANALYGATALDLPRQGVYHVEGGIGGIAETLVEKIEALGGEVLFRHVVRRLQVDNGQVQGVYATKGRRSQQEIYFPADFVIANTTPWSLKELLAEAAPAGLHREVKQRDETYGAFVLHLGIRADALPTDTADHHQIVQDFEGPMGEGRTLFVSISPTWDASRAPEGERAVTVSTHTNVAFWWDLLAADEEAYQEHKQEMAGRIIADIDRVIPGFRSAVTLSLPGTPVTYAYYTLRHRGMVGGFPQRSLFTARGPRTGIPNLRLVGDSIFPGQSTAGVTLGGIRVAHDVLRQLGRLSTMHILTNQTTEMPLRKKEPTA